MTRALICGWTALLLNSSLNVAGAQAAPAGPVPDDLTEVAAPAVALGNAFAAIAKKTQGSVVSVLSERMMKLRADGSPLPFEEPRLRPFHGSPENPEARGPRDERGGRKVPIAGLGSGFVLDEQGHILTNNHVVEGMSRIHVVFANKQSVEAAVLGTDPKTDLAVLKIKGSIPKDMSVAHLGDSDSLKVGHLVLAFGAPFGLTQTVTSGIVSATGRSDVGIADFEDFVQTDAPINPGNSGGPLVNMRGEVVAINTAIAASAGQSSGVGFAIPINMAKDLLPTLLQGKKVMRGMLGVAVQNVTPALQRQFELPDTKGALVSQVNPGSPAEKVGIHTGDVITSFDGKTVADASQLREFVSKHAPGSRGEVQFVRAGKTSTVTAKLDSLDAHKVETLDTLPEEKSGPLAKFGIEGHDVTPEVKSELGLHEKQGVVVTDVDPTSPAAMAGLQAGDVITEVNRKKISDLGKMNQVLSSLHNDREVLLLVDHQGQTIYVTLDLSEGLG